LHQSTARKLPQAEHHCGPSRRRRMRPGRARLRRGQLLDDAAGECLLCEVIREEKRDARRIVFENDSFVALVPFFARWPYETHIYSKRHFQALTDMSANEADDLAALLKTVLVAFDALFKTSFPYMMVMHQRPVDGLSYDYYHFHIEFYPPMRTAERLKFPAGSETGAGMFINDTLPEEKAAELRAHAREVEL